MRKKAYRNQFISEPYYYTFRIIHLMKKIKCLKNIIVMVSVVCTLSQHQECTNFYLNTGLVGGYNIKEEE